MLGAIWRFIKAVGVSVYKNTLAPIRRWVSNSAAGKADEADKRTASRVVTYLALLVLACWFPQFALILVLVRNAVFGDIIYIIGSIIVDTSNLYARA